MKKILIKGELEVVTGLHIGGDSTFSAIGAVDSPIIRNSATGRPIIPGSSLKGKIRSLLAKNEHGEKIEFRNEKDELKRLFGSDEYRARLIFSDLNVLENKIDYIEEKYENVINRKTAMAMPRQIERVVPGVIFKFSLVYNIINENEIIDDFTMISSGLKLLLLDYLGGGGTRGSGRITFNDLIASTEGNFNLEKVNLILDDVLEFAKKINS